MFATGEARHFNFGAQTDHVELQLMHHGPHPSGDLFRVT